MNAMLTGFVALGVIVAAEPFYARSEHRSSLTCCSKCLPSYWRDVPTGGLYFLAVGLVQQQSGPSLFDRFLPAKFMLASAVTQRWPNCSAERKRHGYPRIIEKAPGKFDFEKPCIPCQQAKTPKEKELER